MKNNDPAGDIFQDLRDYASTLLEVARLKAIRTTAGISATLLVVILVLLVTVVTFLVLTAATALWLGELLGSTMLGFAALGGIYLLMLIVLIVFREPLIRRPLRNRVIRSLNKTGTNG